MCIWFIDIDTWSNWSQWSTCNVTCGHGQQTRSRTCQSDSNYPGCPVSCEGSDIEEQDCDAGCRITDKLNQTLMREFTEKKSSIKEI